MHERNHLWFLASMTRKKDFYLSIAFFIGAILLELLGSFEQTPNPDFFLGMSLAFIICSVSFNIRIIRDFSVPEKQSKRSKVLLIMSVVYMVLIYGFQLIWFYTCSSRIADSVSFSLIFHQHHSSHQTDLFWQSSGLQITINATLLQLYGFSLLIL